MSKRKILVMAMALAMCAILVVGGSLAYFTEVENQTNVFTMGDLKIDLWEKVDFDNQADADKSMTVDGEEVTGEQDVGKDTDDNPSVTYDDIMPGDKMTKVVTVDNKTEYPVYVSLTIKNNGYQKFNQNIDDYYEAKTLDELKKILKDDALTSEDAAMQKITDDIWCGTGWDIQYTKDTDHPLRYEMINPVYTASEGVKVLGYGYANSTQTAQGERVTNYHGEYFEYADRKAGELEGNFDSIDTDHTRMWVIYLEMPGNTSYTVDLTTNCPDYITLENGAAFDEMELDVQAAAIQVNGFETNPKGAFTELHETFGFAY